jgi:hypothetical protein
LLIAKDEFICIIVKVGLSTGVTNNGTSQKKSSKTPTVVSDEQSKRLLRHNVNYRILCTHDLLLDAAFGGK